MTDGFRKLASCKWLWRTFTRVPRCFNICAQKELQIISAGQRFMIKSERILTDAADRSQRNRGYVKNFWVIVERTLWTNFIKQKNRRHTSSSV